MNIIGKENLAAYCIARAVTIVSGVKNRNRATCKICGAVLPRDTGYQAIIAKDAFQHGLQAYLCEEDFVTVSRCKEKFPK